MYWTEASLNFQQLSRASQAVDPSSAAALDMRCFNITNNILISTPAS
jgi:hypothetical protein